jgi:hypothetical protein
LKVIVREREALPAASLDETTARYEPTASFLRRIRPLKFVPPAPAAALRLSVPTRLQRVHFRARRLRLVGLTHRLPLRRPASFRSMRRLTVAASDSRHLNRVPAGVRRRREPAATGVAAEPTRNVLRDIASRSSVGASTSAPATGGSG